MEIEIRQTRLMQMLTDPQQRNEGFKELMKLYGEQLYWHIRRIVIGHDDAEDVLQETCIKILGSIDTLKEESKLSSWMYSIATRESINMLRRQTRVFQSIDDLRPALTSKLEAETPMDHEATEVLFQKALLTLPTQQRIAFNLRYYDELSYEEIARITGKNINTLKTNYHFATEKIKKYIKQHTS
jgi:RNA polymerase sigma-70 factor (ECF subfamily)